MTSAQLIETFNRVFLQEWNTKLIGGFEEPLYLPAQDGSPAEIRFTRDYARSALHEIAHWCIAGEERRNLVDYGYWYRPDGRNIHEQAEFFNVEVKPQSVEMAFSLKCSIPFQVSCDNLGGIKINETEFEAKVAQQLKIYESNGFPPRAALFLESLTS